MVHRIAILLETIINFDKIISAFSNSIPANPDFFLGINNKVNPVRLTISKAAEYH